MTTLYGISNCDTVRKARQWLSEHTIPYRFHDFRIDGLTSELLTSWLANPKVTEETLVNRRGTTWRKLEVTEADSHNADRLSELMLLHPSLIKRPILNHAEQIYIGFNPTHYSDIFTI